MFRHSYLLQATECLLKEGRIKKQHWVEEKKQLKLFELYLFFLLGCSDGEGLPCSVNYASLNYTCVNLAGSQL